MFTYLVKNYAHQSKMVCAASPQDAAKIANIGRSVKIVKISDCTRSLQTSTNKLSGNMLGTKFFKD